MIPIDSVQWKDLEISGSNKVELVIGLLKEYCKGNRQVLGELREQVAHQFTINSLSFGVVPYLISDRNKIGIEELEIIGVIRACELRDQTTVPNFLKADYKHSLQTALELTAGKITTDVIGIGSLKTLMGVIASIKGDYNLALHLFLHGGSDGDLSCPLCGEYIKW